LSVKDDRRTAPISGRFGNRVWLLLLTSSLDINGIWDLLVQSCNT